MKVIVLNNDIRFRLPPHRQWTVCTSCWDWQPTIKSSRCSYTEQILAITKSF